MGHVNFSIKGKSLAEVLEKLLEWHEKHKVWCFSGG